MGNVGESAAAVVSDFGPGWERTTPVAERLRRLRGVLTLFEVLGIALPSEGCAERLAAAERRDAAGESLAPGELVAMENRFRDADSDLRGAAIRRGLAHAGVNDDLLVDYLSLIAARIGSDIAQRDRYFAIASRMLVVRGDEGRHIMSISDAAPILEKISGRAAAPSLRANVLSFFHQVMHRLHALTSFEEALKSGLLEDVIGFKIALGADLADPEILHSVVALDLELETKLNDLSRLEGRPQGELTVALRKTALHLVRVFAKSSTEDVVPAPVVKLPRAWKGKKRGARVHEAVAPPRSSASVYRAVKLWAALALGVSTLALFANALGGGVPLDRVTGPELAAISPLFVEGRISESTPPVFLGEVDGKAWTAAAPKDRSAAASSLRDALVRRGIHAGVVRDGHRVVIQIDGTAVVEVAEGEKK